MFKKPFVHLYRGRCIEVRFGWLWLQGGFTLPHVSFVLWSSRFEPIIMWRWGRWLA